LIRAMVLGPHQATQAESLGCGCCLVALASSTSDGDVHRSLAHRSRVGARHSQLTGQE